MPKTELQKRFVFEYLKDLNATAAMRRIRPELERPELRGSQMLADPNIMAAIQLEIAKRKERTRFDADKVLAELAKLAFSSVDEVYELHDGRPRPKSFNEMTPDAIASIESLEVTEGRQGVRTKVKQYSKDKSLELLGRHLGIFNDKLDVTVESHEERLARLLGAAADRARIAATEAREKRLANAVKPNAEDAPEKTG